MAPLHHHFEKSRLEGDAGRRALLDHHHAAVPDRPGEPEAAVKRDDLQRSARPRARARRVGPGDGALVRALRRARARLGLRASRRRSRGAARARAAGAAASAARSTPRRSHGVRAGAEEPGPVAARRAHRRRCSQRRASAGMPVQGELDLFARALADLKRRARLRAEGARRSPAPTARRRRPR